MGWQWLFDLVGLLSVLLAILWTMSSAGREVWLPLVATTYAPGIVLSYLGIMLHWDDAWYPIVMVVHISSDYLHMCKRLPLWSPLIMLCWAVLLVIWMCAVLLYLVIFPFGAFMFAIAFVCVQISTIGFRGVCLSPIARSWHELFMYVNINSGDLPRALICCVVLIKSTLRDKASKAVLMCLLCSATKLLLAFLRHPLSHTLGQSNDVA